MRYYISNQGELDRPTCGLNVLSHLADCKRLAFDLEADGLDPYTLVPYLLGIWDGTDSYIINLRSFTDTELHQALAPLSSNEVQWVAHNAKYDWKLLQCRYQVDIKNLWCTMLSSQVLYNGMDLDHNLAACLERHFQVKLNKSDRNLFIKRDPDKPIEEAEIAYLEGDLTWLFPLQERHSQKALEIDVLRCIELENRFLPILGQMELNGIRLDSQKWSAASRRFQRKAYELERQIQDEVSRLANLFPNLLGSQLVKPGSKPKKREKFDSPNQLSWLDPVQELKTVSKDRVLEKFNLNSTQQIQAIFTRCGVTEITSTGEEVLQQYLLAHPDSHLRKFTELLLKYRELQKLISTYGDSFLGNINRATGRIHSNFSQCFTDTGRLSSSHPNCQNIPPGPDGELRKCFVPDSEDKTFVDVDMSGQEVRVAASYSQDKMLLASFNEGLDLHAYLAQASFRIITQNPTLLVSKTENKQYRNDYKPILFSVLYGGGPGGIANKLGIDQDKARAVYKSILSNLPDLNRFQQRVKRVSVQQKQIRDGSRYNRVKWFNRLTHRNMEEHQIERQAVNFPIQASSANMMKEAGIVLTNYFRDNQIDAQIKLQIHDQYLIQIPKSQPELGEIIKTIMEDVGSSYLKGVRMESELNVNPYWSH